MASFIDDFMNYAEDLESPDEFIKWSAIATVSAILRDNVYFNVGYEKIYANSYVILVGDSGSRKGPPIKISTRLVRDVANTKCIAGRGSIEGALCILRDVQSTMNGHKLTGGSGIIEAEELSAYFTESDQLIKILTDIYEYKDMYDYTLRDSAYTIKGVCLTILGGSNEAFLKDIYNTAATYGGLLARTFIITSDEIREPNSRMFQDTEKIESRYAFLLSKAKRLAAYKGEIGFEHQAKLEYDSWYKGWYKKMKLIRSRSGVEARIHTGILKLAFILAAARDDFDMFVKKEHVEEAIDTGLSILDNYRMFGFSSGTAKDAGQKELFLKFLLRAGEPYILTRKVMLRRMIGDVDLQLFDKIVEQFKQTGFITETNVHGDLAYKLTEQFISDLRRVGKSET